MEIDDSSLYESYRYRILEEMIEENKQKSGYFIMIVDKKSLGFISGAVSVLDLTERGVTVIEQLEKARKPMPEVDALYFLTPTHKTITRLTTDFIEQIPYRQVHLFFTGRIPEKLMRTIANSSIMPYIKTFKEVNCGFRLIGRDCFSLEHKSLLSLLYCSKSQTDLRDLLTLISHDLASVFGVMRELPYICFQSSSQMAQELANCVEREVTDLYRKLPELAIKANRPIMIIVDRSYDLALPLVHDVHYEALLKDLFEVGSDGKVKYESVDNSGGTCTKEAVLNEKDTIWVKLRYEEVDEAQAILNHELRNFRSENHVIEEAGRIDQQNNLKTMAKVASGLSNYNEKVSEFAVHRYLLDHCLKSFADEGITDSAEIEQMILTGFDNEKSEYKESAVLEKIINKIKNVENHKEKLRLAMLAVIGLELSSSDRSEITSVLSSENALLLTKLANFGISLQSAGKTKKRLSKLYMSSLVSRVGNVTKIFNYAIPKLSDFLYAASSNTLEAEGFVFVKNPPPGVEDVQPQAKSLRKKQGIVQKGRKKVIFFVLGGVSYAELRVLREFPDVHVVIGGSSVYSPMEFVEEIANMGINADNADLDPRDIDLDFT